MTPLPVPNRGVPIGAVVGWAVAAAAALLAAVTLDADDGPVFCVFRRCTGGYCPGCGASRATGRLVAGDLAGSWRHHPMVLVAAIQLGIAGLAHLMPGSGTAATVKLFLTRHSTTLVVGNAVVLVAVWFVRLGTASIPAPGLPWPL